MVWKTQARARELNVFNGFVLDQNAFVEIDRISSSIL